MELPKRRLDGGGGVMVGKVVEVVVEMQMCGGDQECTIVVR